MDVVLCAVLAPRWLQVWDTRTRDAILSFQNHEDFIADFAVDASGFNLVAAGYGSECVVGYAAAPRCHACV